MSKNELAIYQNGNGAIELAVDADAETIWATQKQLVELYEMDIPRIIRHINNVLEDEEVVVESNVRKTHYTIMI